VTQDYDPDPAPEEAVGPPGMPRWVKVAAVVVGLLVLLFLVLQLTGLAGEHGPGMHSSVGQLPTAGPAPW
jgi:hypothetical protein